MFQIGVYDADGTFLDTAASLPEPMSGRRTLTGLDRGQRYLAITGFDTRWTVTVEQRLSFFEEWQLLQSMRQPSPELAKLGTWTGDEVDTSYEFTVPAGRWEVTHSNVGGGFLQILIQNEEGIVALATYSTATESGVSWGHQPGKFTMQVKADKTWQVDVYFEPQN